LRAILAEAVELCLARKDSLKEPCAEAVSKKSTAVGACVEDGVKGCLCEQLSFDRGTAEERPGIHGLEKSERGCARELGHHEGGAKVKGGAAHPPLDASNAALGVGRGHEVQRQERRVEHELGSGVCGLVRGNAFVTVNVNIENSPLSLLELGDVAKFLVTVARGFGGNRAPGECVSRLHTTQTVRDHDGDRVLRGSEMIVKGGKFRLVGVAFKGVSVNIQLSPEYRAPEAPLRNG